MFKKVLIVEDLDTIGYGISIMLGKELGVKEIVISQYCDDAYLKYRKAIINNSPFDLMITDLSFEQDYKTLQLRSGKELIKKIRSKDNNMPIVICSVEERPDQILNFTKNHKVSAFVLKGRFGLKELKEAVIAAYQGKQFFSKKITDFTKKAGTLEIESYDITLLNYLASGLSQPQISTILKSENVSPSSLRSVQKRVGELKDILKAGNNVQLVANAKDIGLL